MPQIPDDDDDNDDLMMMLRVSLILVIIGGEGCQEAVCYWVTNHQTLNFLFEGDGEEDDHEDVAFM